MARWKARVEFLLGVIGLLFLSLTVEALRGKTCQNSLLSGGGRSLGAKISGGRGRPWGIFFGFYKTRHRHVMDGQMDGRRGGIAIASRALAMRALWHAVIKSLLWRWQIYNFVTKERHLFLHSKKIVHDDVCRPTYLLLLTVTCLK